MENAYSITVTNKFSLALDEDEDPLEVLKVREQEKEAKKREKLSEKENKSKQPEAQKAAGVKPPKSRVIKDPVQQPPKVQDIKKEPVEKKPQRTPPGADRNVKFSNELREERNNRRNREDGDRPPRRDGGEPKEPREPRRGPPGEGGRDNREFGERRGRGGIRGVGGGRGRGGSRGGRGGFDNRGKREFDRQSGSDKTGVKPVDKKDGAGSHNWGSTNDEIEESLMTAENQEWGTEKTDGEEPPVAAEAKEGAETSADPSSEDKPIEEEAQVLTLDEWKALRSNREKPKYNLRKAGEGEDLSRWKKMYALEKKKEGTEEEEEEEEDYDVAAEYPQRVGRQKHVLDIDIQFSDSRRGGSGRGGRGGRGARGDRPGGDRRGFGGNRGPPRGDAAPGETRGGLPDTVKVPAPQVEQRSPRGRQNAPKVDDEHDFPSLG